MAIAKNSAWTFLENRFQGKKVFITGHTGFKGAWLTYILVQLGAKIKGYALEPNTSPSLFNELKLSDYCESIIADITDSSKLAHELHIFQPDYVFHLAAQPLVKLGYEQPIQTFHTNIMGTAFLLEALKKITVPCSVVVITTDKVYENKEWAFSYRENDPLGGYDPYSASKAAAELVVDSMRNSFFHIQDYPSHQKAIASARAGNVIGGGDWAAHRIIPDIAKNLAEKIDIPIRNPYAIRPWEHVLDPLYGYLMLAAKLSENPMLYVGPWNFGPGNEGAITVEDLCQKGVEVWGHGSYKILPEDKPVHEASLLKLDITKAVDVLKWTPTWTGLQAIERSMIWYKQYYSRVSPAVLVADDVREFFQKAKCVY